MFCAVEHIFNETAVHARAQASNRMAKANRASYGPRVSSQIQVENRKEPKVRTKVPKAYTNANLSGLQNSKSDASSDIQESAQTYSMDTSWSDGWNDDWSSLGWHEG